MPFNFKRFIGCPMNDIINRKRVSPKVGSKCDQEDQPEDVLDLVGASYIEDPDLLLMRKTIEKNPEIFILNNLMMCVQFFSNFDEEMEQIQQSLSSTKEIELNLNLLPQKRALLPDVLQEHVGHKMKFTSTRQTMRPTVEPLLPIRVYLIHDNFEITENNDLQHYHAVNDVTSYNLWLKPSDHKGYIYLQHLGAVAAKKNMKTEDELFSIAEKSDEMYEKFMYPKKSVDQNSNLSKSFSSRSLPEALITNGEYQKMSESYYTSNVEMKSDDLYDEKSAQLQNQNFNSKGRSHRQHFKHLNSTKQRMSSDSPASSNSSDYVTSGVDSDSDYGYSGNSSVNDLSKSAELPSSCFKMVTYTQSGKIYDPREERRQNFTSKQKRIKEELRRYNYNVWYINSTMFMRHFFKLFKQQLADSLGFDEAAVCDAKCLGSVIYCDKIDVFGSNLYTKLEPYEIVPSVWTPWPECAQEWFTRERNSWPSFEMIRKIKEFGCYIVPESFIPKQENNPLKKIEWQLTFPAAERYLETCLNHAQTKILLVALMLHKTFVRPIDTLLGLSTSHIRNKLFWLIEQSRPLNWSEHRTGEYLLKLFSSIYQSISQNTPLMKDYFLKDKNLFQNIPNECLLQSQKQIHRILTNPIMYLIYAMDNIHYEDTFFPRMNFDDLLHILTVDIVSLVNPQLVQNCKILTSKTENFKYPRDCNNVSAFPDDKNKRNEYSTMSTKSVINRTLINMKTITKNPIVEISLRCAEMGNIRLSILLNFFINHFIKTAQRYHQYGAWKQKNIFIAQAERLCILLSEKDESQVNARDHMQTINNLKNLNIKLQPIEKIPEIPQRNIDKPFFDIPLKDRFISHLADDKHNEMYQYNNDDINCVQQNYDQVQISRNCKSMDGISCNVTNQIQFVNNGQDVGSEITRV